MYVRSSLVSDIYSIGDNCESLWIRLCQQHLRQNRHIFINTSYHPPGSDGKILLQYLTLTTNAIEEEYPGSPMFICGDFNRLNLEVLEFESGMVVLNSPNTRRDARLDLCLTNKKDLIDSISTFKPRVETDHLGLLVKPKHSNRPKRSNHCFRLFSFRGHQKLNELLTKFRFEPLYQINDIHEAASWLEEKIFCCVDIAFPVKQVKMSDRDPYWMTPKIKWLIKQRQQISRRNKHGKLRSLDEKIKSEKIFSLKQQGTRSWWTQIDALTHRKQTSHKIVENAFDPEELNVELSRRSALREGEVREPPPTFILRDEHLPVLSVREVAQAMQKCKKTSAGPSNIPHFVYREYWDILSPLYCHLWNRSLASGIFPNCYKVANLIPIPKVKNAKSAGDVRGISVTSIAARLFEKVVHQKWITPRISEIGDPFQFAYKEGTSTVDCLLSLQHYVLSNLDSPNVDGVHTILLDYSKAFDRVNQEKAALTFHTFIESPYLCRWLYDFSTDRQQRLIWQQRPFKYLPIDRGCSQGTVGGPGLFSMFTDDCRVSFPSSALFKYSDDMNCASLCRSSPSPEDKVTYRKEIKNLVQWAQRKDMEINIKKSKVLRFCLNKVPYCQCLEIDEEFECVDKAKILGLVFQSDCSFRNHGRRLISELRKLLYILRDLKLQKVSMDDIQLVFDSLIISRIRYGLSVYGSDYFTLKKINVFLEKCFSKNYCSQHYDVFHLRHLEDQRNLRNILRNPNHPLFSYISSFRKDRSTRHDFKFVRPYVRTKAFHHAFCNRVLSF